MAKKPKNKSKKYLFLFLREIITLILIFLGRHLYIKSLKGCDGDEFSCLHNIKFIYDGMNRCIKSSLLFILTLFLIQIQFSKNYNLIIIFFLFTEFLIRDRGSNFLNHGLLNLFGFFFILIFGECFILIILIFLFLIKKKKYILIAFIFFVFFNIIFFLTDFKNNYFCKNWSMGLNKTYIDNNNTIYPCGIIDILGPFLDFSRFVDCNIRKNREKYLLLKNSNLRNKKDIKRIGYPITINEKDEEITSLYGKKLVRYVTNHLIDMDDRKTLEKLNERKMPEIILDYNNNSFGELKININFKKKLSKKRKKLEKNDNSKNILFIFFDNLSRVHFYGQYKKTSNFLKKFFKYKGYTPAGQINTYHAFEFFKYHKLPKYTLYNTIPMFSGVKYNTSYQMISILRYYKKNGFITCNIQDICHKELMKIGPLKNYLYIEFDHEYAAPSCDPNIYNSGYDLFYSENGILKKCLYGRENFNYSLEYARQFWRLYKNNKKFLRLVNTYAHEYSGEKSKYTDINLYNFLKELFYSGQMENTTLFIAADHGYVGLFGVYKILESKDWEAEYALPILIIVDCDKKNVTYEEQFGEIKNNQQKLVTPFDIYYTLSQNLFGIKYKNEKNYKMFNNGESLFEYINPKYRTCSKYNILKRECRCI